MDLGLLILAVLTIGMAIGTIYGSWATDNMWKEHLNDLGLRIEEIRRR